MVIILAVTGIAVLLLLLESAVPYLRGSITLERDMENPSGETVRHNNYHYIVWLCMIISEGLSDYVWAMGQFL